MKILYILLIINSAVSVLCLTSCSCDDCTCKNCMCVPTPNEVQTESKSKDVFTNPNIRERTDASIEFCSCIKEPEDNEGKECGIFQTSLTSTLTDTGISPVQNNTPWVVGIEYQDKWICLGSLIHPRVVITTKHNVRMYKDKPEGLLVISRVRNAKSGNNPGTIEKDKFQQYRFVESIKTNGPYSGNNVNDSALLILENPFIINESTATICLRSQRPPLGNYEVIHWEMLIDGKALIRSNMKIWNNLDCQKELRKTRLGFLFRLDDSFICVGGAENQNVNTTLAGGGPLVYKNLTEKKAYLIGMISWAVHDPYPEIFVDVTYSSKWIENTLLLEGILL